MSLDRSLIGVEANMGIDSAQPAGLFQESPYFNIAARRALGSANEFAKGFHFPKK